MNNEIKEHDLTFGDAIILPNNEENWKFILADRTYALDAPTEVIVSRMLEQLLAEQAKNSELDATLKILKINHKLTISELNSEQAKNKKLEILKCDLKDSCEITKLDFESVKTIRELQAKNKKLVEALEKISNIDNICSGCEFKIDSYCRASKSQEINYLKDQEKCLKNVNYYNDKIITLAQQALNEVNK